jgi:hypothetical protein
VKGDVIMEQYMIICPECGEGYWVSPMTLKIHCHNCGTLVFHRGLAGFIDWQAMAIEAQRAPHSRQLHMEMSIY